LALNLLTLAIAMNLHRFRTTNKIFFCFLRFYIIWLQSYHLCRLVKDACRQFLHTDRPDFTTACVMQVSSVAKSCVDLIVRMAVRPIASLAAVFPVQNARLLVKFATGLFKTEQAVLCLSGQFTIVGDLHGSLDSILRVFSDLGWPPARRFLFLGDYVDRGDRSTEVLLLLYALKLLFPEDVFLLRGNHECRSLTSCYGFKSQIEKEYSEELYDLAVESFDALPIAAIVNDVTFCVHGGFSPQMKTRNDVFTIVKPKDDPVGGMEADLLWSDFEKYVVECEENVTRGCGWVFGVQATENFLRNCGFTRIVRSHQSVDGYEWPLGDDVGCVTVFTAVDYMEKVNDGAVVTLTKDNQLDFQLFHPMLDSAKRKWRVIWPAWLLEGRESMKKFMPQHGLLQRTMSHPVGGCDCSPMGIEIKI
jgi:diadenosine tetraphosphatase ApaH/serine/threonine PP2A family protein phosphatase